MAKFCKHCGGKYASWNPLAATCDGVGSGQGFCSSQCRSAYHSTGTFHNGSEKSKVTGGLVLFGLFILAGICGVWDDKGNNKTAEALPAATKQPSNSPPEIPLNTPLKIENHLSKTEASSVVPLVSEDDKKENKISKNSVSPETAITPSSQPDQPPDFIEIESTDGRRIRAKILALLPTSVLVHRDDGQKFEIPLSSLTDFSRKMVHKWRSAKKTARTP